MPTESIPDPIAEARARVALRYQRARPVAGPAPDIGHVARKLARKRLPKAGSGLARLKDGWRDIVGDGVARYCQPVKLSGGKAGRTLTLRVVPQAAPLIQHKSAEIRQRVSVAAGGDIVRLKLEQGPLGQETSTEAPRPRRRSLNAEELAWLEDSVKPIADPALRAAAVALGRAVLSAQSEDDSEKLARVC